jgi:hypothetical protein
MKLQTLNATFLAAALALLAGCSKEPSDGQGHDHPHDQEHAPAGVVAGSYEDWCGEHAVPESKCTRCNPSLVAAFKAAKDWCAEHGLPESQCLKCNPDLKIERPPKP